jgi:hypothetical protein
MTNTSAVDMRVRALLSMQRAMLGMVTPSLRAVAVSWDARQIRARFIYDQDGDYVDLVQETETQVLADFEEDVATDFTIEVAPEPTVPALTGRDVWIYRRRES